MPSIRIFMNEKHWYYFCCVIAVVKAFLCKHKTVHRNIHPHTLLQVRRFIRRCRVVSLQNISFRLSAICFHWKLVWQTKTLDRHTEKKEIAKEKRAQRMKSTKWNQQKTETETRQKQTNWKQPTKEIELQEKKNPIEFDLSFNQSHII